MYVSINVSAPPKKEKLLRRHITDGGLTHPAAVSHLPLSHTNFSLMHFKFEPKIPVKAGRTLLGFLETFSFHPSLYCTSQNFGKWVVNKLGASDSCPGWRWCLYFPVFCRENFIMHTLVPIVK